MRPKVHGRDVIFSAEHQIFGAERGPFAVRVDAALFPLKFDTKEYMFARLQSRFTHSEIQCIGSDVGAARATCTILGTVKLDLNVEGYSAPHVHNFEKMHIVGTLFAWRIFVPIGLELEFGLRFPVPRADESKDAYDEC